MTKLEKAAVEYDWTAEDESRDWNGERPEQIKIDCFTAGARWALEQMTSEEAVEMIAETIWQAESLRVDRGPRRVSWAEVGDKTWETYRPLARAVVAAVRKEIEA